ncbi:hypothetical protein B0H16DRAFT_1741919 [Mycena metata]|uniref:Uncharacterized protein n=1 Tax=Mycena metata TaxID=1033252 RepID=A0AAD7MG83_9AGAR|nr:hypothetical protein B0H16DRAFT_1741919 [Mycena metata]
MTRQKKNIAPGRKSDFVDEKATWLDSFKDTIVGAGKDEIGAEYTDITNRFILRYGYDLPITQNVDNPEANPPVIPPNPSEEEKARRVGIRTQLRQKLGNWYRTRYRNKKANGGSIKMILSAMQSMSGAGQRPRRKSAVAIYSKLHYDERLKADFDKVWAAAKETTPANMRISMSQNYVHTRWEAESDEFKAGIEEQCITMHAEALEKWRAGRQVDQQSSAEDYHEALGNLEDVGIPLADALAERLGMHVVILAVGPVGEQEGQVRLRTVFSDTSFGQTSKTWSQYDHRGFTAMEESITRYGNAFFTKADCDARAWPQLNPASVSGLLPMPPPPTVPGAVPAVMPVAPAPAVSGLLPMPPPPTVLGAVPAVIPVAPATAVLGAPPIVIPVPPDAPGSVADVAQVTPNDGIDRTDWDPNFVAVYNYLSSKHWGPDWDLLLQRLIHFEWSNFFNDDLGKIQKITHRPTEIPEWMKRHRVLVDFPLDPNEAPFGARLLAWWQELGPKDRWSEVMGTESPPQDAEQYVLPHIWKEATQFGRNGIQLVILALAWWGQDIFNRGVGEGLGGGEKALAAAADWQRLMKDVSWLLSVALRARYPDGHMSEEEETGKGKKAKVKAKKAKKAKVTETEIEATAAGKRKVAPGDSEVAPPKAKRRKNATPAVSKASGPRPQPRPLTRAGRAVLLGTSTTDSAPTPTSVSTTSTAKTPDPSGAQTPALGDITASNAARAVDSTIEKPAVTAPDTGVGPMQDTVMVDPAIPPPNTSVDPIRDIIMVDPTILAPETAAPNTGVYIARDASPIPDPIIGPVMVDGTQNDPVNRNGSEDGLAGSNTPVVPVAESVATPMDVDKGPLMVTESTEDPFAETDPFGGEYELTEEERAEMLNDPDADEDEEGEQE